MPMPGASISCSVRPQSQTYRDGLERVELYVRRRFPQFVNPPPPGQRVAVIVTTATGTFKGGLRTLRSSGEVGP